MNLSEFQKLLLIERTDGRKDGRFSLYVYYQLVTI